MVFPPNQIITGTLIGFSHSNTTRKAIRFLNRATNDRLLLGYSKMARKRLLLHRNPVTMSFDELLHARQGDKYPIEEKCHDPMPNRVSRRLQEVPSILSLSIERCRW